MLGRRGCSLVDMVGWLGRSPSPYLLSHSGTDFWELVDMCSLMFVLHCIVLHLSVQGSHD